MIYTCERCHKAFEHDKKPGGYRFCSQTCANQHAVKLGREELLPYAEMGALNHYMARRLEVSPCTIRRALIAHGLYRLWTSRRYQKCASQAVGPMSASIASAANVSSTPSSRLEVPTDAHTNCGN